MLPEQFGAATPFCSSQAKQPWEAKAALLAPR